MPDFSTAVLVAPGTVATTSGNSAGIPLPVGEFNSVQINTTAVSGTTPSAAFKVQWSQDGTNWADADPVDSFTAITATGSVVKQFTRKAQWARLAYTITGTTPSFTFGATVQAQGESD